MLNAVTVINYLGDELYLELSRPDDSGFYVQEITGLGPPKANINVTDIATLDGGYFNSARSNTRNIVMKLGFLFNPTIEDTRLKSYKYFPVKKPLTLVFTTDERSCAIQGYVESNENTIFSKEEGTQISIICPDPFFYSTTETGKVQFSAVLPEFSFPFSNESTSSSLIEFGSISFFNETEIEYEGDVDTGFTLTIHALGSASNIALYDLTSGESLIIDTSKIPNGLQMYDDLIISTVRGQKRAKLYRNGVYTNALNCLGLNTDWPKLHKGNNTFMYTATGAENIVLSLEYKTYYEGI